MSEAGAADAVRARNAALDRALIDSAATVEVELLDVDPGDGEWTLAQNLAHIGEFPGFFAAQLEAFLDGSGDPVGRLLENERRLGAVDTAADRDLDDLRDTMARNFARLAAVLDRLTDSDLDRIAHNGKYGDETVAQFLARYVLGHKAEHVDQLGRTIQAVARR